MTRTPEIEPADLELALSAAREAGQAAMEWFRASAEVRFKGPDQPLTDADLAADRILADRLLGSRPDDGWLSEESARDDHRLERERVWVVDPIDGTRSFVEGYREFGVSVALVRENEPVLGVIYNPARDEVVWAIRGAGARRARHWHGAIAGEPIRVAAAAPGERPALLASRTEIGRGELEPLAAEWTLRPLGSTAYKLATLAHGAAHGYLSRGPKSEWDVAAGAVIVEEAGGRVTDLRGRPLRFNERAPHVEGVVAGGPAVHRRLLELVAGLPPLQRLEAEGGSG